MLWSSDLHKNLKVNSMWMIKTRWSKAGASNWNTKFVFLLPVELQIGAFVLMSWPLSSFSGRCPSSSMQSWKIMKRIGLYFSGKVCLIHELLLSGKLLSSKWHQYGVCQRVVGGTAVSFQVGFSGCPLEASSWGHSLRGQDRASSEGYPTTPVKEQKGNPSSRHSWKSAPRGQEGLWPLPPCRASRRPWQEGNTVVLWAGGHRSQWPKLLERHDVSRCDIK